MENQEYNDFDIAAMSEAVKMSGTALTQGQQPSGGPFGAAIYKNGKLIAASYNHVLSDNDPSAHGEVYTIREACKALIDEPIVLGSHPASALAAILFSQRLAALMDGCNVGGLGVGIRC